MLRSNRLLLLLFFLYLFPCHIATAPRLPSSEKKALEEIAAQLKNSAWNFADDPCDGGPGWVDPLQPNQNNVTCDCSTAVCHITSIVIKSKNLSGTLPADLSGLPYLRILDLTRNYINGSIPREWGSTKLVKISLLGNRLTGPIPKEIGNISTLRELVLEYNQLSGVLPPELGNLSSIQFLFLTSNNFTGELPGTFARLTTLTDLRIGDNPITGRIPEFLQNLKNLQRLYIYGNNLTGPIPHGIGLLENMTDLRISDLVGGIESEFPPLSNMKNLYRLILKNCNLVGNLPDYWDKLTNLQLLLDLSFNKLTGELPSTFITLANIQYMFLTANMFSGKVPDYLRNDGQYFDLSYNNFSAVPDCNMQTINLFASSSMRNVSKIVACLRDTKCPSKKIHSMKINCGGDPISVKHVAYDGDSDPGKPSKFFQSDNYWVYSSTGNFINSGTVVNNVADTFIQKNKTVLLTEDPSLYVNARISPLSLTYYGYCLQNGDYNVTLHFAEIRFTNDNTYKSLGRRFFDIYIQGALVRKDFNIKDEAGGVGIPITRSFGASVVSNTLEIRLYWAGKGTDAMPEKGVYGPLISAITVTPNFPVSSGLLPSAKAAALAAAAAAVIVGVFAVVWWHCLRKPKVATQDLKSWELNTGLFTLKQIKSATKNFDPGNKIGEGGFGSVYKGHLSDGTTVAVKQLSSLSKQGTREFLNEVGMISALRHPHLVKLHGCCIEGSQLLLVYEYMENNCLARALYGPDHQQLLLDWPTRLNICTGIARGLSYLHEESMVKIVHRDIKATNVLLDKHMQPKISDFGLAKLTEDENSHVSTRIAGTFGYMAPEYAMRGQLSRKADVYSFGVVVLEIVSGKSTTNFRPKEEDCYHLLDWALLLKQRGRLLELIDLRLGMEYDQDEVLRVIDVALLCATVSPAVRPSMSSVVRMLEDSSRRPSTERPCAAKDDVKADVTDTQWSFPATSEIIHTPSEYSNTTIFTS